MPVNFDKNAMLHTIQQATPETDKDVCLTKDWIKQKTFQPNTTNGWGFTAFLEEAALKRIGTVCISGYILQCEILTCESSNV